MKNLVLISLIALSSAASAGHLPEDKSFSHHLFETEKKCEEYKRKMGGWFNCSQSVTLHKDGSARIIVTDIVNPATYNIEGNKVTVTPVGPGEIGQKPLVFTITRNQRNLVDQSLQVWEWREDAQ